MPATAPLTIEGTINARDLGGLPTLDGRRVRNGALLRSAELNKLTARGAGVLRDHGIATILDLRSTRERLKRPLADGHLPGATLAFFDHETSGADLERLRAKGDVARADVHAMMLDIYRRLPWEQAGSFRLLFELVETGQTPLLFHCAAGKDRTGVAAALLLCALGVKRSAIYDDFMMSEHCFDANRARFAGNGTDALLLRPEWDPILHTHPGYLDAMFGVLEHKGGLDGYFADTLGFDAVRIERLRNRVLEAA